MQVQRFLTPGSDTETALEAGRDIRTALRRGEHGELALPPHRDPIAVIEKTHSTRIADLIGVRVARMTQSVYAYFRGTVDVMTGDLAAGPRTGVHIVIDADAHLGNFGLYASPERRIVFDLNDFDEAGVGPWEWDIKRLATSLALVQRSKGVPAEIINDDIVALVTTYATYLRTLVEARATDRYFASVDAGWFSSGGTRVLNKTVEKARQRTSEQALDRIGMRHEESGRLVLKADPPLLIPRSEKGLASAARRFEDYRYTLLTDRALLLSQYRVNDAARRVVGVSSVGTHCSIVLLQGPNGEPLILQSKEALPSVLETQAGITQADMPGVNPCGADTDQRDRYCRRVTEGQRVLQATSDPFLGRTVDPDGRNHYWRQFRDHKGSVDLGKATPHEVRMYSALCAQLLARAHAQSPDAAAASGYLGGSGGGFTHAVATWAAAYADVIEDDFRVFTEAVNDGQFPLTEENPA
ncbi:DUF2252 domain-containing protein [Dermatophilus congolensis]|uniref:Uncharacterized protein conserved in bacteria n=1 Tax=Dermatophilus congolensis TaxID=1863 RepID=A0A239VKP2_9MICO|nr:DUF2252 domain-containing protein [Dermatophilus congolensis]MBO3129193.1 DUF2252 domain-containing protein [Dermatophilus congolensis]MBO3132173.1 DUF2252 domain-containing protein [Dermatophilus congolensis]MBO3133671.1 DUF2252 domain-containing protein [Dermatophilus congolensis]MBO3135904.1 DUF2252 domain-containing protein [Dermatophilus congolensis]MBO3138143.1 DUF2252 domain-containing protein [Dermatophilus congolensis]